MEERARELAERHEAGRISGRSPTPLDRLAELEQVLRQAHARFVRASEEREALSGVAEWLLDNFYIVQQTVRQVEENMPSGYYDRLPKLLHGALEGYPRVYAVARKVIVLSESRIDVDQLKRFLEAYQTVRSLTMGEIWAVPTMLRLSLLELLAGTVVRVAELDAPPRGEMPDLVDLDLERDEVRVASAINSLRAIGATDWETFFEAVSLVERALRSDPARAYADMDFDTRDRYRKVIEKLSTATGLGEEQVADAALELAADQKGSGEQKEQAESRYGDRAEHVGFYLTGGGRESLERAIGYEPGVGMRLRRWILGHRDLVYLGSIGAISGLVLGGAVRYAAAAGGGGGSRLAVAVLAAVPASVVGVSLVNIALTHLVPPRLLSKLDFSDGIPAAYRTMVVVPALLTSEDEVDFLMRQLELHHLGNDDEELGFALLSDFGDAPRKHMPQDEGLLQRAEEGIRRLNKQYARREGMNDGDQGPFYLFHRERLWNPAEDCWMGWERKRGKLVEFNRLLRDDQNTSYTVTIGDLAFLEKAEYVITLDADTVFPMDTAHQLVGTLAHPLNRATFSAPRDAGDDRTGSSPGRVVAGYTVLQPRTEVKPTAVTQTRFTRLFAGDAGIDLYTRAVSDVYQDFFGEGVYTGKGIYDLDAFERSLEGRVPENALLSHDLFEGVHGRAALVSDVVVLEDYPPTYLSYAHRKHRWVRGDWQLLPWLMPRVPWTGEGRIPNRLSALDRWKVFDNLRRSLRAPAILALLVAGWLCLPGSAGVWTLLGVLTTGLPVVTGAMTELARRLRGGRQAGSGRGLETELARWLLSLAFLPYESILMLDAIGTTLIRLTISHKRLLQWTTAAHTVRLFGHESKIRLLWRQMGGGPVVGLLVAALLVIVNPETLPLAVPFLAAWLVSPLIAGWVSRRVEKEGPAIASADRRRLRRLARRTWLFFEHFVGPEDHWLPPDHFQESPRGAVAHRTSPTNIGLMLLSTLSAWDMGYTGVTGLMLRISDAFDSMDDLERYRGHFLNWYNTSDLKTLSPAYVSTVDSGNLAACLMALGQGLLEVQRQPVIRWERWRGLCDTIGVLGEIVGSLKDRRQVADEAAAVEEVAAQLCSQIADAQDDPDQWIPLLGTLQREVEECLGPRLHGLLDAAGGTLDASTLRDLRLWSDRIYAHLREAQQETERLVPWMAPMRDVPALLSGDLESREARQMKRRISSQGDWAGLQKELRRIPSLHQIVELSRAARSMLEQLEGLLAEEAKGIDASAHPELADELTNAREWCQDLDETLEAASKAAASLMVGLNERVDRTEQYIQDMDFQFLYDASRDVFHIGYRVDAEELDRNHYDLLASEARIASLVAVAKRDAPQRHWLHLDRPLARVDGLRALLSWGGSMFEYLMPNLVMHQYDETLLQQSNLAAVQRQIEYGRQMDVPWGVSESGYYRLDAHMNYQYRGFGVPGLGRKRGLGEDIVIAPYASLLAVGTAPHEVLANVERLVREGMLGNYGFYEAVDYTESRLPLGEKQAVVQSYMAHHQGMIIAALTNFLNGEGHVERFHRDARVESVEFLLQEQIPRGAPVEPGEDESVAVEARERERVTLEPWSVPTDTPLPQALLLSNGRYTTVITGGGGGYSAFTRSGAPERQTTALTRWRADTTLDEWGTWIYVHDCDNGALWSAADGPTGTPVGDEEVRFYPHQAAFRRRRGEVSVHTEIVVAPDDDVEIRRVKLTNHGDDRKSMEVTSYGEIVLAPQGQDRRHPAFNKLFIEAEYVEEIEGLLFTRRPQSREDEPVVMVHALLPAADAEQGVSYETDRRRFIGRGRTTRNPEAFSAPNGASPPPGRTGSRRQADTTGATLDPIMCLGQKIEMQPHATTRLAYLTAAAETRREALALVEQYRAWPPIDRAFDAAHAQSEVGLRSQQLEVGDVERFNKLLSALLYPHRSLRAEDETLTANRRGQAALWSVGISGDYPILLLRIAEEEGASIVRELLRAHAFWRERRLKIDLVILNERDVGYAQELNDQLHRVIQQMDSDTWLNRRGGVFLVQAHQMQDGARVLLETAARVVLDAERGSLVHQIKGMLRGPTRLPALTPTDVEGPEEATRPVSRPEDLQFDNGFGGFSPDGREYIVFLPSGTPERSDNEWTPAPWINVVANKRFGFLVSEAGLGHTWSINSGENRLTPWRNDPVSDVPAEAVYLRDEETGSVWSPTPLPAGEHAAYLVRHGAGYTVFEHNSHGLEQRLRLLATRDEPVKVVQLRLHNTWERHRRLTVTYFAEWVLGVHRDEAQQYVVCSYDAGTESLLARNSYNSEFGQRVAFAAAGKELHGVTADRAEFLGQRGDRRHPAALDRVGLASVVEPGLDPCAALQVHVDLAPGETEDVFFLLGQGADRDEALHLVERYRDDGAVEAAWEETTGWWDDLLGTVQVRTPDRGMDLLLNRWLPYQALACRIWGRSALYQSSGAYGFRDQLQDVMALLHAAPHLAREHILRSAAHQFEEGDVLHWWHPPSGRGVRTRISDDLLWLPYATAQYLKTTGDETILDEPVPFRKGEPLQDDEEERYGDFEVSQYEASLYEHCLRALGKASTSGPHGLPLIGAGDWNDGLNRMGLEGRGESVWLGWFLYANLIQFAEVCDRRGDFGQAQAYREQAEELQAAVEESAWDGGWYIRATYDDGTPLGSSENEECQIASMAQSWAVLSGTAEEERKRQAMNAVAERLVKWGDGDEPGLVLLFTPPFDETERDPGYIKGYPPGIRENGGQYTHAALWTVWAYTELGEGDRAGALFRLINPIYHSDKAEKARRYRVEPYVVAADVYSADGFRGMGGWTWYTGSSGWMHRLGLEAILGLRKEGDALRVAPCIPREWSGYRITYRYGETVYRIAVENPEGVCRGVVAVKVDGEQRPEGHIALRDDGATHEVQIRMGLSDEVDNA